MLLEKLAQQHRVHHIIADAFHLTFGITIDEVAVYFLRFFGDQAKTERLRRVKLLLKAETHRFKLVKRMAGGGERFDVLLITLRRDNSRMAKSAIAQSYRNVIVNTWAKTLCRCI